MKDLATLYRAAQFYAHAAHNLASGPTFFEDHEYLGELYGAYESAYDDLIERMIGLGVNVDISAVNKAAVNSAFHHEAESTDECFAYLLDMEDEICDQIKVLVPKSTDGTQNLLQGLADDSEKRQYKLGQRLKK